MPLDDDDDADETSFGAPLPPDDRLWRHPSEMSAEGNKQQIVLVSKGGISAVRTAIIALVAGLVGAGVTIFVVANTDVFVRERKGDTAVQRQEVPPAEAKTKDIEVAQPALPSIARVEATTKDGPRYGTAVIFRNDGYLVTTAELVDGALADGGQINVTFNDDTTVEAKVAGRSPDSDIALLHVDRILEPATLAGHGAPNYGLIRMIDASSPTRGADISVGVVLSASTQSPFEAKPLYGLVQIAQSNDVARGAGTVVIDEKGSILGMVTARGERYDGETPTTTAALISPAATTHPGTTPESNVTYHYALSADHVWSVAGDLAEKQKVVKPDAGMFGESISAKEAQQLGISGGVRVLGIERDGPAARGNQPLKVGDVIVGFSGNRWSCQTSNDPASCDAVLTYNDLIVALRSHKPGDVVKVEYYRGSDHEYSLITIAGKVEQQ